MSDLSRKSARARLAKRPEPYWMRLDKGAYLGFRRGPDTWHARFRASDGRQHWQPLHGVIEFDDAKRAAEAWLTQVKGRPLRAVKRGTVREALEAYVADLRRNGRDETAVESEGRFKAIVYPDRFAALALESLTVEDTLEFRDRLRANRQNRSINRHLTSIVAGLNAAHKLGHVGNPEAWRIKRLRDDTEDGESAVFLDAEQRASIIKAATPYAAAFLRGLELSGARPNELAKATVADFDGEQLKLAHRKGRPPKLRIRYVVLSAVGAAFFKEQVRGKLPSASIFTEDGEQSWRRHVWAREFRAAVVEVNKKAKGRARIPVENRETDTKGASAYSFRHARISELLQIHRIDPLTVAAQTGTSIAMLEKAYFKFIPSAMRDKLAAVREG